MGSAPLITDPPPTNSTPLTKNVSKIVVTFEPINVDVLLDLESLEPLFHKKRRRFEDF